jgi:hypothetical protein
MKTENFGLQMISSRLFKISRHFLFLSGVNLTVEFNGSRQLSLVRGQQHSHKPLSPGLFCFPSLFIILATSIDLSWNFQAAFLAMVALLQILFPLVCHMNAT